MAEHGSDYTRGEMDISAQVATFHLFNGLTKWGSLVTAALLLLLVLWFCTKVGFLGALISALVLTVLGVAVLREKPAASH